MYSTSNNVHQGHNPPPHYNSIQQNGHSQHQNGISLQQPTPVTPSQRSLDSPPSKDRISVVGIPSVSIQNNQLVVGGSQSSSTRSYTPLKVLGDGSFGTVWLCDWHGTLPPNTPLSPMQCGAGAKPAWAGKRLVAVKRMKKRWEGGWDECKKLKELESLRAIPFHPNIIPLYDFFLLPASKELYFVFESMEGNLYHLIKARKGRALAGGLVCSIFHQIVAGLYHIHASGYFHRDMKPENVLVTTTGLFDYTSVSPIAAPNCPKEKDVVAIIKLADFGLARETKSKPPYTEYVSTRWYRAPEVLLLSRDYSNPVDMWALGTIMAELVNLRPLFPGSGQIDQVARICEILGDPSDEYGLDSHGNPLGGGKWSKGIKMAKAVGFAFPKIRPKDVYSLFEPTVPISLIECIGDLLKYDPDVRLTSLQCLEHRYLRETMPRNNIPLPSALTVQTNSLAPNRSQQRNGVSPSLSSIPSRHAPPSHSHHSIPEESYTPPPPVPPIPDAASSHRSSFYTSHSTPSHRVASEYAQEMRIYQHSSHNSDLIQEEQRSQAPSSSFWGSSDQVNNGGGCSPMDISPRTELPDDPYQQRSGQPMDIQSSPMVQEYPSRPQIEPADLMHDSAHITGHDPTIQSTTGGNKLKLGLPFKKHSKWGLGMFGGDKSHPPGLPPVDEIPVASSSSTPSLKRTQSSGTDQSLPEMPPIINEPPNRHVHVDVKKHNKKEAERLQREAEQQRRKLAEKMQREQARAVMQKRTQMGNVVEWAWHGNDQPMPLLDANSKGKQAASGPVRQNQSVNGTGVSTTTVNAAAGRFVSPSESSDNTDWRRDERMAKVRRRDYDDDHSMSSSDVHSVSRLSAISFATVDSDPGPSRVRNRPSVFGLNRMTSTSSLRTSFDDFPPSARSSNSFSLEGQLAHDFRTRANVDPASPLSGSVSPPPMHMLSLSPSLSPSSASPSPPWMQVQATKESFPPRQDQQPAYISMPPPIPQHPQNMNPSGPPSPYEFGGQLHGHPPSPYGRSPSPGHAPKSAINPIFKVPPLPISVSATGGDRLASPPPLNLPPFSQLEAVAEGGYPGDYPPLSPMAFHLPEEDV